MKDMKAHLEKLLTQAADCEMICALATDPTKRELFARLAEHHRTLVIQVQRVISTSEAED
jgi:hypothetical protein